MFKYVEPTLIEYDAFLQLAMETYHARFKRSVADALTLLEADGSAYPWMDWVQDEDNWRKAFHPLLSYWSERRVAPLAAAGEVSKLQIEMKKAMRFFLIPLLREGAELPAFQVVLDDRGQLRFPGHTLFFAFGEEWSQRELACGVKDGRLSFHAEGLYHGVSVAELLGTVPASSSSHLHRRLVIADERIEWAPSDELVRGHLNEELLPILRKQSYTEDVEIPPHENFSFTDIWFYEKVMQVIQDFWPQMYREMVAHVRMINIMITDKVGGYSMNHFPSAVFLSHRPHSLEWSVENLIHECSHSRMYQLFEIDPIFREVNPNLFSSPWRKDPRPLEGIFHAVFVFVRIAIWYRKLVQHQAAHGAQERLDAVLGEVRDALDILRENASFTEIGQAVFNEMQAQYDRIASENMSLAAGGI